MPHYQVIWFPAPPTRPPGHSFKDILEGITVHEEVDEVTGLSPHHRRLAGREEAAGGDQGKQRARSTASTTCRRTRI